MSKPTEGAAPGAPARPFRHEIRVGWGDCDPARIAYTARIPEWALAAIDAWWDSEVGPGWFQLNIDLGHGTPFVHMTLDFRAPVTPRHRLVCEVALLALGNTSLRHRVTGRQDGTLCFQGEFVSVFVDSASLTPRRPPPDLRARLQDLATGG